LDGQTGLFYHEQTPEALADAIRRMEFADFDPVAIRRHAERFSAGRFKRELHTFVEEKWREFTVV
jgi:hypothetical protein